MSNFSGEIIVTRFGDPVQAIISATEKAVTELAIQTKDQSQKLAQFTKGYSQGNLRASISYKKAERDGNTWASFVFTPVEYAAYVEFGTRYMEAQPFMRPAAELILRNANVADVNKKYGEEEMKKQLNRRKQEIVRNG